MSIARVRCLNRKLQCGVTALTIWLFLVGSATASVWGGFNWGSGTWQSGTTTYTYDELGRLVSAAPAAATVQYVYDAAGNRTQNVAGSSLVPVAGAVSLTVNGNTTNNHVTLSVTGGVPSNVAVSTAASHGMAAVSGFSIYYTPATNYGGSDSFQYTATNSAGTSSPATVTVTVNVPAPVAGPSSAAVTENTTSNPIALNLSGGAATSVSVSSAASHGTATASGTSITYTPTSGYVGADSFQYTATNATATSPPATVSIAVNPPAPIANNISPSVNANSSNNPIALNITGGAPTSVAVSTPASHGTATASGTSITYTPTTYYVGSDSFAYTASNAGGTSAPATANVTVNGFTPVTHTYTSGALATETVPMGAGNVIITVDGGGGGGQCFGHGSGGAGGGGSGEAVLTIAVMGGNTMTYTVGAAGSGSPTMCVRGTAGGNSSVSGTVLGGPLSLIGGGGGASSSGGAGGTASGGSTNTSGGAGGSGGPGGTAASGATANNAPGGGGTGNSIAGNPGGGGQVKFFYY